ncbi:serine hydrolase [Brevundimonas sp.]|uniref:serine hydrolase domain-containing protein n=1 Tax=Brevundimonas sp. TaxID=1871086 RepID=UPI00260CD4AC|nr:serine hydrolase domain-containing protein [Brevundimonas sp.]
MNRTALFLCLGAALAATPTLAQQTSGVPPLPATLAAAMEGKTVPAVGVLVIRNGEVVDQAVAGIDALGSESPATIDDLWNLGSDSKAMTVTMIARLVERGVLSWEAPLSEMLPDLAAEMRPEYRDVTLVDLMSHRAGLPENHSDEAYFRTFFTDTRPLQEQRLAYLRLAVADAPVGPTRGEPSYSNTGLILAGAIAEQATGKSYETLMQEEVFGPLGMTTAVFNQIPDAGETSGHIDGRMSVAADGNPQMILPAGGVRMTLADWARFCIDQMAGEAGRGKLLKPETYRLMHTPRGDSIVAMGWGVPPQISGRAGPALTHGGSDGNWFAFVALFPGSENGVLAVANAAETMGGEAAVKAAARAVIQTLAPAVPPAP